MTLEEFMQERYPRILERFYKSNSPSLQEWVAENYPSIYVDWEHNG